MECTIIAQPNKGLEYSQESIQRLDYFKKVCLQFNGEYAFLGLNSYFQNNKSKRQYAEYIK